MNRILRYLLVLLSLAGIGVGLYLTLIKLWYLSDPSYASLCNVNATFNCDKVNSSEYSEVWGVPLGLYGIAFYAVTLVLSLMSLSTKEKMARAAELVFGLSVLAVLSSFGLAYISAFKVGAWCLGCVAVYTINLLMLVVSYKAAGGGMRSVVGRLDAELAGFLRSPLLYVAGLLFAGVVLIGGGVYREQVAEAKQRAEDKLKEQLARTMPREARPTAPEQPAATTSGTPPPVATPRPTTPEEEQAMLGQPQDLKLLGHEPIRGKATAPVTILAWKDFECPHCSMAAAALDEVVRKEPDKVAVAYKQYPLDMSCNPYITRPMHENACNASIASMCAGRQGQFWEMHDLLFRNQQSLTPDNIKGFARSVGLDMASFESCLNDRSILLELNKDIEQGKLAGVNGTPAIFINGRRWNAAPVPELLVKAVQQLSAQSPASSKPTAAAQNGPK